jgi:DNA-binding GntR family transcriptional regulator
MDEITQTAAKSSETLASNVYERLRGDILQGILKPGEKLRLQALKESYEVGNSPIREALNRLSSNGMVTREENRGFRVSPASIEKLQELIKTRCWLEEIALRESIKHGDSDWEEKIVLAYHWLSRSDISKNDPSFAVSIEWENHHREFHLAILSACKSEILLEFCAQLHELTLRYRNLAAVVAYRDRHELDEHRELQDAVLARDADKAVELLTSHYQVTADIVISSGSLD